MLRLSLAALVSGLCLVTSGPALAQASNPLGWLLGNKAGPETAPPANPAPPSEARPAEAVGARNAATDATAVPAKGPAPAQKPPTTTEAAPAGQAPGARQAAASVSSAAQAAPLNDQQVIAKANAYFNGLAALVGDFVQTGGDGRRLTGKLYLQRPGKIRFEYDAPATIEVIADGTSVAVRDRKLATQDLYLISQTPLKFLLRDRIDLGRDIPVTGISNEPEGARIQLEDKSTLGGTSKITLFFDKDVQNLLRWRIVDPQGFTTIVALSNLDKSRRVDNQLFVINYERMDANPR